MANLNIATKTYSISAIRTIADYAFMGQQYAISKAPANKGKRSANLYQITTGTEKSEWMTAKDMCEAIAHDLDVNLVMGCG